MKIIYTLILGLLSSYPLILKADNQNTNNQDSSTRARMEVIEGHAELRKMIDHTALVYSAITKGPHGEVPATVLKNTRCIAVLPSVVSGALIVGGAHGSGLASCRDNNNEWSQPAAITFNQGSIGLQAGAKSADLVMFFTNAQAEEALKRGEFTLGADISAVAGNFDSSIDTSKAGVVAYARTAGLFAGASITGGKLGKDNDQLATYYGKGFEYSAILNGKAKPDRSEYTDNLIKLFPK